MYYISLRFDILKYMYLFHKKLLLRNSPLRSTKIKDLWYWENITKTVCLIKEIFEIF